MIEYAIIGGTGLTAMKDLIITEDKDIDTPYGSPSATLRIGKLHDKEVIFLSRHGAKYAIPPHRINYRANIWALHRCGVRHVLAVNAVGGITHTASPTKIVIPDQIIDYTHSRASTYFEDDLDRPTYIDFGEPYSEALRQNIIDTANALKLDVIARGTYAATQGPRLESRAEIARLEQDGCDVVGMTAMPEASLARELDLHYASISVIANWAAGKGSQPITMEEIQSNLTLGMDNVIGLITALLRRC